MRQIFNIKYQIMSKKFLKDFFRTRFTTYLSFLFTASSSNFDSYNRNNSNFVESLTANGVSVRIRDQNYLRYIPINGIFHLTEEYTILFLEVSEWGFCRY